MSQTPKIIVALDFDTDTAALEFVEQVNPGLCRLKVGKEMYTRYGPDFVKQLHTRGFDVFLDLKFHDIPNTVARTMDAVADLGVWMVNVHALGGKRMMEAAAEALAKHSNPPLLIAVTVLTSMEDSDLQALGIVETTDNYAFRLAKLSADCGLAGVVCSAHEAQRLRAITPSGFLLVTPGIRLENSPQDDQRRIMTPSAAIAAGSDFLVIGRPVTRSSDCRKTLYDIAESI